MLCMLTPKIVKSLRLWLTYALDSAHRRVARDVRVTAMYWVEGVRSPQPMIWADASPTPLRQPWSLQIMVVLFGGNRNSGVFRWFRSNSEFLSYDQKEVPVKNSSGKNKNPKESGGILAGMKNRVLEMDIPETGKCNLGGYLQALS